jgi:hypothetical protein
MEYQAFSELALMKALEMVFRALLLGSLLASAVAVGVVACLCLFEGKPVKRFRQDERLPLRHPRREAEALVPPAGPR